MTDSPPDLSLPYDQAEAKWIAKQVIRVEMTKLGMGYRDLAGALARLGVVEDEKVLRNKVARGTYSAAFLITCMMAMKVRKIDLEPWMKDLDEVLSDIRKTLAESDEDRAVRLRSGAGEG